jgi:hypothetical protein
MANVVDMQGQGSPNLSSIPHGTMRLNPAILHSGSTFSAKPCIVTHLEAPTPIAAIFLPWTQTPVRPSIYTKNEVSEGGLWVAAACDGADPFAVLQGG